jgi:para-nitrobenzyl esterase
MKLLKDAEAMGVAFVEQAGVSSLAELRSIEADSLPKSWMWPIIDNYVIPDDQYKLYEAGQYNDVPVLIGYNSDEGLSFTREKDPKQFIESVEQRYGPFADSLLAAYPVGDTTVPKTARDLARDAAFGWQTWSWARLQTKTGKSKVFFYYFDQHPDYPEDSPKYGQGSPHGQEVAYVFKYLKSEDENVSTSDLEISEAMATYWTNFAKYGDPNGENMPEWPVFNLDDRKLMYFSQQPFVGPVPSAESLEVLDDYFEWRRTDEGAEWAK